MNHISIPFDSVDDRFLIRECISGNRHAQKTLYDTYSGKMMGVCLRYATDRSRAEDILQEGFIKIFNNLHKFRNEGSFEGWIRRIIVNTAIEHVRKEKYISKHVEIEQAYDIALDNNIFQNLAANELLKLLQQLPPGYRTVFNLYAIEGYTHREIAVTLNIKEGTSKSQLAKARYTLQKMIKEVENNEKVFEQ